MVRMRIFSLACVALAMVFIGQVFRVQVFTAAPTAESAQEGRTVTSTIPALRGTIFDQDGDVLAMSTELRVVAVDQKAVADYKPEGKTDTGAKAAAAALGPVMNKDVPTLEKMMTGDSRYKILAKHVKPSTWRKIQDLKIPGISSTRTTSRIYPQGRTTASLVGFVRNSDDGEGVTPAGGLELARDKTLAGTPGADSFQVAPDGERLPFDSYSTRPSRGRDIQLTLDTDVQWYAQTALREKVKEHAADSGTVVVQDVKTGKLLAIASDPTFDPNNILKADGRLGNFAFSDAFEPGSTAKVMLTAAALEEGVAKPNTPMVITDRLRRSDTTFRDSHDHGTIYLTFSGALAQSSNIGMILAGEKMSPKTIDTYYRKFGVGKPTGVNFPAEQSGQLAKPKDLSGSQRYTIMFGQGLSMNAIQTASTFQTLANGGVRIPPSLIIREQDPETGEMRRVAPPKGTRVVSKKTAAEVTRMLEGAVSPEGTAPAAAIPGYRVAGKTGTADRYDERFGGYRGKTASFIGFAPADNPRYVVAVIVQNPKKGYFGGQVAAPVFHDVMGFTLASQGVPPSNGKRPKLDIVLGTPPSTSSPSTLHP